MITQDIGQANVQQKDIHPNEFYNAVRNSLKLREGKDLYPMDTLAETDINETDLADILFRLQRPFSRYFSAEANATYG